MRISRNIFTMKRIMRNQAISGSACKNLLGWLGKLVAPVLLVAGCTSTPVTPVKPPATSDAATSVLKKPLKI